MYQYKERYTLDFSKANDMDEVHQIIKEELDFPDYYGRNMDALWDCLTDMITDPTIHMELIGIDRMQHLFPKDTEILLDILKDLKHCYNDRYSNRIMIEIIIGDARYEIH